MMRLEDLPFLQELTPARRQRVLALGVALWALALLFVVLAVHDSADSSRARIAAAEAEFKRAAGMARTVSGMESQLAALAGLSPLAAAQQVTRDLGLERKLTAIRPTTLGAGGEGVQMIFESLNLTQLLDLLKTMQNRGGLRTLTASLSRRPDAPGLADLQLVVVR